MARLRLDKVSQRIYEAELKGTTLPASPPVPDRLLATATTHSVPFDALILCIAQCRYRSCVGPRVFLRRHAAVSSANALAANTHISEHISHVGDEEVVVKKPRQTRKAAAALSALAPAEWEVDSELDALDAQGVDSSDEEGSLGA